MATAKVKKMALGGMGAPAFAKPYINKAMGAAKPGMNPKPGLTPVAQKAQFQRAGTTFGKPGAGKVMKKGGMTKGKK